MPTFDMADDVTNTRQDTRGVWGSEFPRASWKQSVRQRDSQIERLVSDRIENFDFAHGDAAFWLKMKTHVTRLDRRGRDQFEIMRGNHFFVRPKIIHREIFPAQIEIKETVAREILAVGGR
jgi:hypothetical protein